MIDNDSPAVRRAAALGVVTVLHLLFLAMLASTGVIRRSLAPAPARLIMEARKPPPEPPLLVAPKLMAPLAYVPAPEIRVTTLVSRSTPNRTVTSGPPVARQSGHFAAATDTGLGLDVGASQGGGAGDRSALADFEAAVRRQVVAGKLQPVLAWDRRNTCIVGYTVRVGAGGRLLGFSIDACAVPEINAAARSAIEKATFPTPPGRGAPDHEVHGSLVFRP